MSRCGWCGIAVDPGGFIVEKVIAQNDHARVYLARKLGGALCVLKELLFSAVPTVQALEAFERECSLLEAIDHPQIPRFLGRFREGTGIDVRLYLVQQYITGESLHDRVQRRVLSESEALIVSQSVLKTLEHLHGLSPKIVHRDIKPANLITDARGRIHLVDFGAARLLERNETHQGTVVGTFGYMPLEQFGGTLDETADLHALGATLLHALTGREPATFLTPEMVLQLPANLPVSPETRGWLGRLVAPRKERFRSAAEARAALLIKERPPRSEPTRPRSFVLHVLAPLGVLGLLGVLAFVAFPAVYVTRPQEKPAPPEAAPPVPVASVPSAPGPVPPPVPVPPAPSVAGPLTFADKPFGLEWGSSPETVKAALQRRLQLTTMIEDGTTKLWYFGDFRKHGKARIIFAFTNREWSGSRFCDARLNVVDVQLSPASVSLYRVWEDLVAEMTAESGPAVATKTPPSAVEREPGDLRVETNGHMRDPTVSENLLRLTTDINNGAPFWASWGPSGAHAVTTTYHWESAGQAVSLNATFSARDVGRCFQ